MGLAQEHLKGCGHCRQAVSNYHNGSLDKEIDRHVKKLTGVAGIRGSMRSLTHAAYKRLVESLKEQEKRALLLLFKHPPPRRSKERRAGMDRPRFEGMLQR